MLSKAYLLFQKIFWEKIVDGDIVYSNKQEPTILAAHFDGEEYTEDELKEIRQFAEFVKGKRR